MEARDGKSRQRETEERRSSDRLSCSRLACSCIIKPGPNPTASEVTKRHGAALVNICADGIRFETDFEPSAAALMCVEIRPIEGPQVAATIKALHIQRSERSGFYLVGTEFEEISARDRQNLLLLLDTIGRLEKDLNQA